MFAAGIHLNFATIALIPKKLGRKHRHVCCRHLLLFCRHRARIEKIGAQALLCLLQASAYALQASRAYWKKLGHGHHHVCCRRLLMLCRHRACPPQKGHRHRHVCCEHLLLFCRHRACPQKIGAQASPCLLQASAYALQASRAYWKNWGAGIAMSAAGICLCFAGIAFLPKNGAQASTSLLQAPAFALQASRSYGKVGRRHLTPFGVLKI